MESMSDHKSFLELSTECLNRFCLYTMFTHTHRHTHTHCTRRIVSRVLIYLLIYLHTYLMNENINLLHTHKLFTLLFKY